MASDLHDKMKKSRLFVLSFDGARRGSGLGAAAWNLWLRDEFGPFEKVSYGGRVLMNASAMIAEREALRMGTEHLTVLFPTEGSSSDRTAQYKLNAQSLRLFGLHRNVNDAHRAGANRLQTKRTNLFVVLFLRKPCSPCTRGHGLTFAHVGEEKKRDEEEKRSNVCIMDGQLRKYFTGRACRMQTTGLPCLFILFDYSLSK